jgi:hypothetical protein
MKRLFWIVTALLMFLFIAPPPQTANAQKQALQASCVLTVPASWGEYKGASRDFGLAFQDSGGTLRFIRDLACEVPGLQRLPPAYLEVRRK